LAVAIQVGYPSYERQRSQRPTADRAVAGEYVQLDVDLFLKAFSTVLHVMAGTLPCAEASLRDLRLWKGCLSLSWEDTPFKSRHAQRR